MKSTVTICRGFHSEETRRRITATWADTTDSSLCVLVPPTLEDLSPFERFYQDTASFPERPLFGLFSSGTTGTKLIFYSRRNLEASLEGILSFFERNRIDSIFCYPQPYHVFGLSLGYVLAERTGWTLHTPEGPYARTAHDRWLETVGAGTLTLGTPAHLNDLVQRVLAAGVTPPVSYSCILGGAPVPRALWHAAQQTLRIQAPSIGYGASELSPGATHLPPGEPPREDGEVGFPLPNLRLTVTPGEGVRVSGENVCVAMVEEGTLSFPSEIGLRDDLVRGDNGSLRFSHRTDLVINRGGEKFSLEQIERLVWEKLGLRVVAVGKKDKRLGEELALLVPPQDPRPSREAVYDLLRRTHARDFDPALFFALSELPMNRNAKIDRQACRQFVESQHGVSASGREA